MYVTELCSKQRVPLPFSVWAFLYQLPDAFEQFFQSNPAIMQDFLSKYSTCSQGHSIHVNQVWPKANSWRAG